MGNGPLQIASTIQRTQRRNAFNNELFHLPRKNPHSQSSMSTLPRYNTPLYLCSDSGVYLSDLTFIEDGNPNMLRNNEKLINFSKRMKTAEVIRDLQQYQTMPYPYQKVHELQKWLDNELENSSEVQELYELSVQVEPREREDEKM